MKIVGLTGGIGSGKTTVGKMFQTFEIPLYIADEEAKKLMHTPELVSSITNLLGERAYSKGKLDRSYIADQVFNNDDLLQELNAIVHPAVGKHFSEWCEDKKAPYVIKEAAILFENSSYKINAFNILVTAPEKLRLQRVLRRDDSTKEKVQARMRKQWSDEKKIKLADFIIDNIELEKTEKTVQKIHVKIMGSLVNS